MSRHKNMLFKFTYVATKRNNVATNTFLQNQSLELTVVTKKDNVAT